MKQKIAWVLVGLLVGVLIVTAIPVGAHHNDRKLKRRVTRLENQVQILRAKTVALDTDGFFYGPVLGRQVVALCPVDTSAMWTSDGNTEGITWLQDCLDETQQRSVLKGFSARR